MATLAERIEELATGIGNYLRDSVLPRLVPTGGTNGQVLTKLVSGFGWQTISGGGGGRTIEDATITLPKQTQNYSQTVARPGTLPTQSCQVWLAQTDDTDDNTPELLSGYNIDAECGTDEIIFHWRSSQNEVGPIKLKYEVI